MAARPIALLRCVCALGACRVFSVVNPAKRQFDLENLRIGNAPDGSRGFFGFQLDRSFLGIAVLCGP